MLAGAVVHFVGPFSAGSGIPAMKSILSGVRLKHYLSYRTLISKAIGIICAYSAGLFVGKEGPYVHICAALAYQLSRLRIFERIKKNDALRFQTVAAGCAAGLAVTFGAPVGGVLFSIEVTSTYYLIASMSKAFFTAVCAALFVRLLSYDGTISSPRLCNLNPISQVLLFSYLGFLAFFSQTHFPDNEPYKAYEIVPFVCIGSFANMCLHSTDGRAYVSCNRYILWTAFRPVHPLRGVLVSLQDTLQNP
jgi:H+/Cl- antiporter ClcA